ncbi:hypothetical protein F5890DRAFT_1551936 [Lentinula detonsa]|uniref:Uncharacterized protein n=1 Tax=Lentinula detonsa TaxID=2804962 RepID=A0AA38UU07_9AGAR|nr:hypothetical protein F5890DRAFT_1551936 [Lentinula detonsa]
MLRTPPGEPSNTRQRQRTITNESSNSGVTESTVTNPFVANAQSLSPFNCSRFARIQNVTNITVPPSPPPAVTGFSNSPSIDSLRRLYVTTARGRASDRPSSPSAHIQNPIEEAEEHDEDEPNQAEEHSKHGEDDNDNPQPSGNPGDDGGDDGGDGGGGPGGPPGGGPPDGPDGPDGPPGNPHNPDGNINDPNNPENIAMGLMTSMLTTLQGLSLVMGKVGNGNGSSKAKLRNPDVFDGLELQKLQSFLALLALIFTK